MVALGFEFTLSSIDPEKEKVVMEDITSFTRPCYYRPDIPDDDDDIMEEEVVGIMDDDDDFEEEEDGDDPAASHWHLMLAESTRQVRVWRVRV